MPSRAVRWSFLAAVVAELLAIWFDLPRKEWLHPDPRNPGPPWMQFHGLRGFGTFRVDGGWETALKDAPPFSRWLPMLLMSLVLAGGLWALERWCARRPSALRTAASLASLTLIGYGLELSAFFLKEPKLQGGAFLGFGYGIYERVTEVNYSGYLNAAIELGGDSSKLFSGYSDWLSHTSSCFHCIGHPPGPIAFYWFPLQLLERLSPQWVTAVSTALARTFDVAVGPYPPPAALTAMLCSQAILLLAAAIVVPAYGLAKLLAGRSSLRLAVVGLLLPGLLLTSVGFDQIYATFTAGIMFLFLLALMRPREAMRWGCAAGLAWAVAMFFSTAFFTLAAPVLYLGTAAALGNLGGEPERRSVRDLIRVGAGLTVGASLFFVALRLATGFQALEVLRSVTDAHVQWDTNELRGYWPWLFYNLVDFSQFLGIPLLAFCILTLREPARMERPAPPLSGRLATLGQWAWSRCNILTVGFFATIIALDLTGATRSEVGRLWTFLMPLAALSVFHGVRRRGEALWLESLLAGQLLVCLLMVARWAC